MDAHEKECALAALAYLLEKARREFGRKHKETRELEKQYREILKSPID